MIKIKLASTSVNEKDSNLVLFSKTLSEKSKDTGVEVKIESVYEGTGSQGEEEVIVVSFSPYEKEEEDQLMATVQNLADTSEELDVKIKVLTLSGQDLIEVGMREVKEKLNSLYDVFSTFEADGKNYPNIVQLTAFEQYIDASILMGSITDDEKVLAYLEYLGMMPKVGQVITPQYVNKVFGELARRVKADRVNEAK